MLGPNNREACWEDSVGKIFSSCESKPLWKHSPAGPAGRLTAPDPLLPLSHTQDGMAALSCSTSWPTAQPGPPDKQLETPLWEPRPPYTAGALELHCSEPFSSRRTKDTPTNTRNLLLYVTMTLFKFWAWVLFLGCFLLRNPDTELTQPMRPWVIWVPRWGSNWRRGAAAVKACNPKHLQIILTL